jgi:hypothetical protein
VTRPSGQVYQPLAAEREAEQNARRQAGNAASQVFTRDPADGSGGASGITREPTRIAAYPQLAGRFRRWWQVMDSNHRRRSRRFYRPFGPKQLYAV